MRSAGSRAIAISLMLALLALGACTREDEDKADPAPPTPVAITFDGPNQNITLGIIVTLTSAPGEGADWIEATEGARVAAYRLGLSDTTVNLVVADDKGSVDGAREAVTQLAGQGASGIVLASTGAHLSGAIAQAGAEGIPMVLPYTCPAEVDVPGVWCTGATPQATGKAIEAALALKKSTSPLVLDVGGGVPEPFSAIDSLRLGTSMPADDLVKAVKERLENSLSTDGLVISGAAPQLASSVAALQGAGIALPVVLPQAATSPAFGKHLSASGASLGGEFLAVGLDTGDAAALHPTDDGRALSAFVAAATAVARDNEQQTFFDEKPFVTVAGSADPASHDAVIALAAAATAAYSTAPGDVAEQLGTHKLTHRDGLAGPALDFTTYAALADGAVVPLRATADDPGLRPASADAATARLFWFAAAT